jgi:hypothetical protein
MCCGLFDEEGVSFLDVHRGVWLETDFQRMFRTDGLECAV